MKKYFVTWVYMQAVQNVAAVGGSNVLSFDGDFDLYDAHKFLQKCSRDEPVIILNWQPVTEAQDKQYQRYVDELLDRDGSKKKAPLLRLAPIEEPDTI